MTQIEIERSQAVATLKELLAGCTETYARQLLQKYDWNMDQAATALLDTAPANEAFKRHEPRLTDEIGLDIPNESNVPRYTHRNIDGLGILNAPSPAPARPNSVIDLTGDDDEDTATAKAIEASMESHRVFGPSNRIDTNEAWAMVPSNAPPILSQEDRALNEALEASLTSSFVGSQELYDEAPDVADRVRKEGWPFAFRVTSSPHCYIPVVLQCILSIPKIQERLLEYDPQIDADEEAHALARQYQRLTALSGYSARAYIPVDELLDALTLPAPISNQDSIANLIRDYFLLVATELERIPRNPSESSPELPLLTFKGGNTEVDIDKASSSYASGVYIEVTVPTAYGSDIVSCLAHSFLKTEVSLTELSEVFTFIICREDMTPVKYPSRLYMDRFTQENVEQARKLAVFQEDVQNEVQKLSTERQKLVAWKDNDTLKALRSTVHYFEHLACDGGDPVRKEAHARSKEKLHSVIKQLESDVEFIDARIKRRTTETEIILTQPQLQQYAYDLHGVIIHDGLFGRTHLYSYTKDAQGKWWKIVDYQVCEVTEEMVLNDQTGLHLAAGPILLVYTRVPPIDPTLTENRELRFPRFLMDLVKEDNETILSEISPAAPGPVSGYTVDMQ